MATSMNSARPPGKPGEQSIRSKTARFVFDSGCTHVLVNDLCLATGWQQSKNKEIQTAGGGKLAVEAEKGTMNVRAWSDNGRCWQRLRWDQVLYVPDLVENLIGIGTITRRSGATTFSTGKVTIFDSDGTSVEVVTQGQVPTATMVVCGEEEDSAAAMAFIAVDGRSSDHWHARLGHPSRDAMRNTRAHSVGHDIPGAMADIPCETCSVTKARSHPSQARHEATQRLEAVAADLIGPWHGNDAAKYVLGIRDLWSGYAWTITLASKKEAARELMKWAENTKAETGQYPRSLRVDQGETWSNAVLSWATTRAIKVTASPTGAHTQNAHVERQHQQIEKVTRSLMHHHKTSELWWPHAVNQATYITNRLGDTRGDGETPYERWHGKPPTLKHLRVFGCEAFAVLTGTTKDTWTKYSQYRSRYLRERALRGLYLGYSDVTGQVQGHRVFVPALNRVVTVRDVRLNENVSGQEADNSTVTSSYFWVGAEPEIGAPQTLTGLGAPETRTDDSDSERDEPASVRRDLPKVTRQQRRWNKKRNPVPPPSSSSGDHSISDDEIDEAPTMLVGGDEQRLRRELALEVDEIVERQRPGSDGSDVDEIRNAAATTTSSMEMVSATTSSDHDVTQRTDQGEDERPLREESESPDPIDAWDPRDPMPSSYMALLASDAEHEHPDLDGADKRLAYAVAVSSAVVQSAAGAEAPTNLKQAQASTEWPQWQQAMEEEMRSLQQLEVYDEVQRPNDRKPISTKWVFTRKKDGEGKVVRYKARLVARGFVQKQGLDFDQIFSPVARIQTIRLLLAYAAQYRLHCHTIDIKTAFLHGKMDTPVFVEPPPMGSASNQSETCWKLKRALYGLRQSPRLWHRTLQQALSEMGFTALKADSCVMVRGEGKDKIVLGIYVDDILVVGAQVASIERFKQAVRHKFSITDGGAADFLLGISILRGDDGAVNAMHQKAYIDAMLQRYSFQPDGRLATRPTLANEPLRVWTDGTATADSIKEYASMVGSLTWLAQCTRPDLCFAVGALGRYMANPGLQHFRAAEQVLAYVYATQDLRLELRATGDRLKGYADSDWGSDIDSRRSTSGFLFTIWGTSVSWKSRLQPTVALSSVEAEYVALSQCAKEAAWLCSLLSGIDQHVTNTPVHIDQGTQALRSVGGELALAETVPVLYSDSSGARSITVNPEQHDKTKHIDLAHHYIRDLLRAGKIEIRPIAGTENPADILTKALPAVPFAGPSRSLDF